MIDEQLASYWKEAGRRFGFRVISPYTLSLNNVSVPVAVLLPEFGAPQGMLLVSNFLQLKPYLKDIDAAGYGFSAVSAYGSEPNRASVVELLADWGWSGRGSAPSWLRGS